MILDFFPAFLGFMSILNCSVPYCLWFPSDFGLFPCFSLFYIHMEEYRSLRTAKSTEVSRLRRVRKSPDCKKFGSLKTTMSTEVSKLRRVQKSPNCDEFRSSPTCVEFRSLRIEKSCTESDKKVSYLLSGKRNSYVKITVTFPKSRIWNPKSRIWNPKSKIRNA